MSDHGSDVLITKDSGGSYTWPKMQVADELGIPIVIIHRHPVPGQVPTVSDPAAAAAWIRDRG